MVVYKLHKTRIKTTQNVSTLEDGYPVPATSDPEEVHEKCKHGCNFAIIEKGTPVPMSLEIYVRQTLRRT